ncbi:translation elongation factor Ts [Kozakia baliensis]|uniref:Elongation factor Ts n=1 Tax=Kozakia baliensis TaxID=153496 RepID=A0A1D8UTV1_9PROT|nr:translation elongation factor Ts [Kozakia baliensis]AOX17073.1 elongation factor Ts [Kozakia baliensis]GBR24972.1 elongation factor Ts [Kozakia baliensis NRIC 0488]GEL63862.1 elongation factor Ts [Kozakia baliensis]
MAEITAALVRDLREKTGAGMMDCKKALTEAARDMDAAIDWLRTKGLSQAAKKSGRVTAEGLIAVASAPQKASIVEINAETDFVGRNEAFQDFVESVAKAALEVGDDLEAIKQAKLPSGRTVADELTHLIATIGENMSIRRAKVLTVPSGVVASYVHSALRPGIGKIGVLAAVEAPSESEALETLGRQIGMHVAATRPSALDVTSVDPEALDRERAVLSEQARESGKPEAIIEKMVEGRIRKFYEEVVLLEQIWVHDGESRVAKVVEKAGAKLTGFERFQLGEGIEKEENDFAAEVAKAAGG